MTTPPEFAVFERWLAWLDSHDGRIARRLRGDRETDSDLLATIPDPPGSTIFTVGDLRKLVKAGRTLSHILSLSEGRMTTEVSLFIDEEGLLEFIYSDDAAAAMRGLGTPEIKRVSHVESSGGRWTVDVAPILNSKSPVIIGDYPTRSEALQAEMDWVLGHLSR